MASTYTHAHGYIYVLIKVHRSYSKQRTHDELWVQTLSICTWTRLDRLENYSVLEKNIETLLKNEGKILKLCIKVPSLRNAFFFVVRLLRYMTESENHE